MKHEHETAQPAPLGQVERGVRPCAWMAQHGGQPVQATVSEQQAAAWAQAGGDVVELYDGPSVWNAIATTDARRRGLQAQIEQLQDRLAHAGIEQRRAVREERERCAKIVEAYRVPVGNSAAGEMAAEWTMDALREVRDAIRGA